MKYLILFIFALGACTSKEAGRPVTYSTQSPKITTTKPKQSDVTAQMLASEAGSNMFTQIYFKKGSSVLTTDARKKLQSLFQKASKQKIDEVQVVTWADIEYPEKEKNLYETQQELVEKRNDQLERTLKNYNDGWEIKKVSMAFETNWLEELTEPTSAEVKESMEDVDIATKGSPHSGEKKASRSIIIFVPEK